MASLTIPETYGNVIAVAAGAIPLLAFAHGMVVGVKRKAANIPYPHVYATQEQCKADPAAEAFNNAQRAHGNYLENMPQTMAFLLIAGTKYPTASTVLGISWIGFRTLFMYGYVFSGKPRGNGRHIGTPYVLCQGALWAMSVFGVGWPMMGSLLG